MMKTTAKCSPSADLDPGAAPVGEASPATWLTEKTLIRVLDRARVCDLDVFLASGRVQTKFHEYPGMDGQPNRVRLICFEDLLAEGRRLFGEPKESPTRTSLRRARLQEIGEQIGKLTIEKQQIEQALAANP